MRFPRPSLGIAAGLLITVSLVTACGGQTQTDIIAQGGQAGSGAQPVDAGDAGNQQDAGICGEASAQQIVCGTCRTCGICDVMDFNSSTMVDCAFQLASAPSYLPSVYVVVDCARVGLILPDFDASVMRDSNSWIIDYLAAPARLVFGAALCGQIEAMGDVPIYLFIVCGVTC